MHYRKTLAKRTRLVLALLPIILFIFLMIAGHMTFSNVVRENSRQLTRQEAVETNLDFQRYMSAHYELLRQMAHSQSIARWIADTQNSHYAHHAIDNILGFYRHNPQAVLSFTAANTKISYLFTSYTPNATTFADTSEQSELDREEDAWFWDTMEGATLTHIDIEHSDIATSTSLPSALIWLNTRVYQAENPVGVASVGFSFEQFMVDLFVTRADKENLQVYIVDMAGNILMDSRHIGADPYELEVRNLSDLACQHLIGEQMAFYVEKLANRPEGLFPPDVQIGETFDLENSPFDFATLAPIAGTNWVTVVLGAHVPDFWQFGFFPLTIGAVVVTVLAAILSGIALNLIMIAPLERLTASIDGMANNYTGDDTLVIYGQERTDEVGYLANTIATTMTNLAAASEEVKRVQILEESSRAKSRFLARMSHEIRTPISAILGISEIQLKRGELPNQAETAFHKIHTSGHLLYGIINDILDLSRIESGKMEMLDEPYQVASLISDVMQAHLESFITKDLTLDLHVDCDIPTYVIGDVQRIHQILNNILSNASKYTLHGGVLVEFGLKASTTEQIANLCIVIQDTGIGMSPEQVQGIFNEYSRFSEKEYRNIDGTGLGMSIVNQLLQLMDATIDIKSNLGQGTKITLVIPQQIHDATPMGTATVASLKLFKEKVHHTNSLPTVNVQEITHGRVLVVDDLDINLYVAEQLLSMYALDHVELASSGDAAIRLVQAGNRYDVIFMDHMMPGMDGVETLNHLRGMGYAEPVVVLTANAMLGQEEAFLSHGFDDFLSKPIQTRRFHEVLVKYIDHSHSHVPQPLSLSSDHALVKKLHADFVKNQSDVVERLAEAVAEQDTKAAHLIVHSLKGVAGLIDAAVLVTVAEEIETQVRAGQLPSATQLEQLEQAVSAVLHGINLKKHSEGEEVHARKHATPLASAPHVLNDLLHDLALLLDAHSTQALALVEELQTFEGTQALVEAIEDFDFPAAKAALDSLKSDDDRRNSAQ